MRPQQQRHRHRHQEPIMHLLLFRQRSVVPLLFATVMALNVRGFNHVAAFGSLIVEKKHRQKPRYMRTLVVHSSIEQIPPVSGRAPAARELPDNDGDKDRSITSHGGGTATIPSEVFNLVMSIIGACVLSLPAGISAYGNAPSAVIPAIMLLVVMGSLSAYTFSMIARVCSMTGASSYADAWDKTRGRRTSWIIAASSTLDCFTGSVTYSMVLADAFQSLLAAMGISVPRSKALLSLTTCVLLPLCMVKKLSVLAPFSLLGIIGMLYTAVAIGIRFFDGTYAIPAGKFLMDLSEAGKPVFGSVGASGALSPKSLILISMFSTAYIAHFNAPTFFRELKNNTIDRFNTVVRCSFGIAMIIYGFVMSTAFLTFGANTAPMALNSYSTADILMTMSRLAVILPLTFAYPLLFSGTRNNLMDLIKVPESKRTNRLQDGLTLSLLSIVTALALQLKDLTLVESLSGAVFSTPLTFIFPSLMFRSVIKNLGDKATARQVVESRLCAAIAWIGVAVACIGAKMAILGA
jgi:amino acid permease